MWRSLVRWILPLGFSVAVVDAAEVVYVTDLEIFTSLAPCAASALDYNIQSQTYSNCPEAVTALQSCVCTKNDNLASISKDISSSVSYGCGSTASEDQASAETVLSAYCDQASMPSFPTPTVKVSQYITDIPEISNLAPCASGALSYAVMSMTYTLCPSEATALATCACAKNQNSLKVSQIINTSAKYSCDSHTADISSAQAIFAAYCDQLDGTTSFPTPTAPPGDMSYYITALTQFSELAPCAASAVSYAVMSQAYNLCPSGPEALASCACIKGAVSSSITSSITSQVQWSCDSTATEDIASAIEVFDFYCSAARAEVTAAGVTESLAQTVSTGSRGGSGGAQSTGTSKSDGSRNGSGADDDDDDDSDEGGPNAGVIAGAVVGAVGGLGLIAIVVFFVMRSARKKKAAAAAGAAAAANPNLPPGGEGKAELAGNPAGGPLPPSSPSPSTLKVAADGRINNVSPVSGHAGAWSPSDRPELQGQGPSYPPMPQHATELQGPAAAYPPPNRPELMGQAPGYPAQANTAELTGQQGHPIMPGPDGYYSQQAAPQEAQGQQIYEFPSQANQMHGAGHQPAPAPGQPGANGMGWQSGPVANYHELDGNYGEAR